MIFLSFCVALQILQECPTMQFFRGRARKNCIVGTRLYSDSGLLKNWRTLHQSQM